MQRDRTSDERGSQATLRRFQKGCHHHRRQADTRQTPASIIMGIRIHHPASWGAVVSGERGAPRKTTPTDLDETGNRQTADQRQRRSCQGGGRRQPHRLPAITPLKNPR